METKRYPLTEEIDGVNGYVEISKGRQKFVMKDGKKVAHSAFMSSGMDEIFFPDSLEKIGNMAFMHCWKLKTIHFGSNIKTMPTSVAYVLDQMRKRGLKAKTELAL